MLIGPGTLVANSTAWREGRIIGDTQLRGEIGGGVAMPSRRLAFPDECRLQIGLHLDAV